MYYCGFFSLNEDISNYNLGMVMKRPVPYIQKIKKSSKKTSKDPQILKTQFFLIFFESYQFLHQTFSHKKVTIFSFLHKN
jgi:hypothetical protein